MGLKQLKGNAPDDGYIIEGDIHISYRSLEALYRSAVGLDNEEAAEHMGIGVNTYRNHVYAVMKKLREVVEVENEGLESLLGEVVTLLCCRYIYTEARGYALSRA